jgi:hypothetical protein
LNDKFGRPFFDLNAKRIDYLTKLLVLSSFLVEEGISSNNLIF